MREKSRANGLSRKWDVAQLKSRANGMSRKWHFPIKRKALAPRQYALNVIISNCIFVNKSRTLVFLTVGPHK